MEKMQIIYWQQNDAMGQVFYEFESDKTLWNDVLNDGGFANRTDYIPDYFHVDDNDFIELYSCESSNSIRSNDPSIVLLGNYNEGLFCYYCRNDKEKRECVKYLLEMARDIVQIEYHRKFLDVQCRLEHQ